MFTIMNIECYIEKCNTVRTEEPKKQTHELELLSKTCFPVVPTYRKKFCFSTCIYDNRVCKTFCKTSILLCYEDNIYVYPLAYVHDRIVVYSDIMYYC